MFAVENPRDTNTQEQKSYLSVYLWMLAYIKRLERKTQKDKFGAADLLLREFRKLDKRSYEEQCDGVANLIGMSKSVLFETKEL